VVEAWVRITDLIRAPAGHIGRRGLPAYAVFAGAGLGAAILWGAVLQRLSGSNLITVQTVVLLGLPLSGLLALSTRIRTGRIELVYLQHFGLVLVAGVVAARATSSPTLPTLDVIVAGMCVMQSLGRVGCHLGGCCYGRPARRGVVYAPREFGFGAQGFAGVPLAPVQLTESAGAALLAGAATWFVLSDSSPGSAVSAVFVGYGSMRIATEAWRGDHGRRGIAIANNAVVTAFLVVVAGLALALATGSGASQVGVAAAGVFALVCATGYHIVVRGTRLRADDLLLGASMVRNAVRNIESNGAVDGRSGVSFRVTGAPDQIVITVTATPPLSPRDVSRLQRTLDVVVTATTTNDPGADVCNSPVVLSYEGSS
jgi:hypothetical protein